MKLRKINSKILLFLIIFSFVLSPSAIFGEEEKPKDWRLIPCDFQGKVDYFNKQAKELNLVPSECAYVGDEVNDIPIFGKAGLSIAFNCHKEQVKKAAHVVIDKKDLREILRYFPPGN